MDDLRPDIYRLVRKSFIDLDVIIRYLGIQFHLSTTESWVLLHLEDSEGLPLSELAFLLIRDKSNMTSLADKLEKEGLATRKPGKNGDRRYTRIALPEQGQHLRSHVIEPHDSLLKRCLKDFPMSAWVSCVLSYERSRTNSNPILKTTDFSKTKPRACKGFFRQKERSMDSSPLLGPFDE